MPKPQDQAAAAAAAAWARGFCPLLAELLAGRLKPMLDSSSAGFIIAKQAAGSARWEC